MRFMVLVKATKDSEAGILPTREQLAEMGTFNEQLVKDGVMLAGEGLQASSKGARLALRRRAPRPSPTAPSRRPRSCWPASGSCRASRRTRSSASFMSAPFRSRRRVEIRQIFELDDFSDNLPDDVREQEERLRSGSK